jgi:spore coat protein U-like protein
MTLLGAALAVTVASEARAALSCSFTTIVPVSFGRYDVFDSSPIDAAGSVTYSCSGAQTGDTIVVQLSRGNSVTWVTRTMLSGGHALDYGLFRDAARTIVWGDGTSGTSQYGPVAAPSSGSVTVPIYGRIPARQNVGAGAYSDTIVATILF